MYIENNIAPTTTQQSAKLKTGKSINSVFIISTTAPFLAKRSIKLPIAPE
jgi:hypothetical protein